jgi:hypothetical protein
MTIDTQHLRELIRQACPLPWALATSNSWRRIVDPYHVPVCSPCNQPDGHPDLHFPGGAEGPTITLLIEAANALPDLLDIIEALEGQVAEYARMLEKQSAEAGARIDAQAAEIAGARQTIERWKERCRAARQESGALKRDISDYIRVGNEQGAEIAQLREQIKDMDVVGLAYEQRDLPSPFGGPGSPNSALAQEQGGSDDGDPA